MLFMCDLYAIYARAGHFSFLLWLLSSQWTSHSSPSQNTGCNGEMKVPSYAHTHTYACNINTKISIYSEFCTGTSEVPKHEKKKTCLLQALKQLGFCEHVREHGIAVFIVPFSSTTFPRHTRLPLSYRSAGCTHRFARIAENRRDGLVWHCWFLVACHDSHGLKVKLSRHL